MEENDYPILEFDPSKRAVIEASEVFKPIDISEYCVICFFKDLVDEVAAASGARTVFVEKGVYGENPYYQLEHNGQQVVFFQPYVGAPMAVAFLEIAIALGCRKFIICGSAGVLSREIPVGRFIVPNAAVRDEGTSYHYIAPAREVEADPAVIKVITSTLDAHGESYSVGKVWSIDALFRETRVKVQRRIREGCLAVDMEAAALFAVAQFREVKLGYLLFGGDDVSGDDWDQRQEESRVPFKEKLFWLGVDACLKL